MSADDGDAYFTPKEVADRWKCSAAHVRKIIDNGELPAFRAGGKLLRIPAAALKQYEERQSTVRRVEVPPADDSSDRSGEGVGSSRL